MEWFEFPISPQALGSVAGIAIVAAVIKLWLEHQRPEWRGIPLTVLGLSAGVVVVVRTALVWSEGWPAAPDLVLIEVQALVIALFGASVGVFGRQVLVAILGTIGLGPESDAAREVRAWKTLERVGYDLKQETPRRVEAVRRPRARGG